MLIYIVRHGETNANEKGLFQGWSDDPLNENGRKLARITGQAMRDIRFDACYSSPLSRARETAEILLRESGNDIPVALDDRIKEVNMGSWERRHFRTDRSELDPARVRLLFTDPFAFGEFSGGERVRDVCGRTQAFLRELIRRDDGRTYLVATHGFALRAMLNPFYDDPSDFWHGHVPYNCAVNIIEAGGGRARLIADDRVYYDRNTAVDRYAQI